MMKEISGIWSILCSEKQKMTKTKKTRIKSKI